MSLIAKWFVAMGVALTLAGVLFLVLEKLGLGKLPGDFAIRGKTWRVYVPLGTSILLSVILTVIMYVITRFKR